jgi:hypothetical protein
MYRYFIDLFSDVTLSIKNENCPIPSRDDEVYVKEQRYVVLSLLIDLDHNRVQIYLKKRSL